MVKQAGFRSRETKTNYKAQELPCSCTLTETRYREEVQESGTQEKTGQTKQN